MHQRQLGIAQPPPPLPAAPPDEKLDYIIQQLQRLPGLISIPLDPAMLNRAIMAMGLKGKASFPTVRAAWSCPAGMTTEVVFPMTPGWYCTSTFITITSDFYDPNITVFVSADDAPVTPWGVVLTGPCEISYGDYFVKRKSVAISTVNNTATDAVLSELCYGQMLEKYFYEEFYAPIIEYMHAALEGVARGQV